MSSRYHATLGLGYHLCKGRRAEVWRGATGQHDHGGVGRCEVSGGAVGFGTWVCIQQDDLVDVVFVRQRMIRGL